MKRLCEIFRSSRKEEMYLYVDRARGLADVPEALMAQFGEPRSVMVLMLDSGRKLARADAAEVLDKIEQQGFYLQMPPSEAELRRRERADG
ncbi:YcgL domain-containing protein [Parahaliea maris]|uniref:YcgL domain-containing protein FV139_13495 n=1 Tax=Parahaliea maris TaxID=2716870 RepID=A0A5C8ZYZ9_9GAMM|nr:YcgL domain-containing protein [Parahaliea maris]TXS92964.1 YcgL domain-containing protein [Parahaliea maris]